MSATPEKKIFEIDPTGHYIPKGATEVSLKESMGYIPEFAVYSMVHKMGLREGMERAYGFPISHFDGPVVDRDTGEYKYPEDPTMYPICRINHPNGDYCFMYPHAMMAFFDKGVEDVFTTRMD